MARWAVQPQFQAQIFTRYVAFGQSVTAPLGVDAHRYDPSGKLALNTQDFARIGARLAQLG